MQLCSYSGMQLQESLHEEQSLSVLVIPGHPSATHICQAAAQVHGWSMQGLALIALLVYRSWAMSSYIMALGHGLAAVVSSCRPSSSASTLASTSGFCEIINLHESSHFKALHAVQAWYAGRNLAGCGRIITVDNLRQDMLQAWKGALDTALDIQPGNSGATA